jgi:NTP pyrophosphatase (non-canonical NTP hydrolase)
VDIRSAQKRAWQNKVAKGDVAIYLLGLAEMTGIDLQDEIEAKMAKNASRVYQRLPNGVLAKSGEADISR